MPTNPYVNLYQDRNDQKLYEELVTEAVKYNGIDALYMPRTTLSNFDALFGDDPTKAFTSAYPVEVYIQTVDQFEGGPLFSKFGLEVRKQAKFLVTNRSFTQAMPPGYGRPLEGDILWLPVFQAFLEIKYADEENMFYVFGENNTGAGLYGYSLTCEKWMMAEEVVATGQTDIDSKADTLVTTYLFNMTPNTGNTIPASGTYVVGEAVNANGVSVAHVVSWNLPTGVLLLKHIQGTIANGTILVGANSHAAWNVVSSNTRVNINQGLDNNQGLATEGNTVVNFSENNPFGQPIEP